MAPAAAPAEGMDAPPLPVATGAAPAEPSADSADVTQAPVEPQVTVVEPETSMAETATGPTPEQQALLARLESWGPAPELTNDTWFNSPPLRLADLQGQVVIVEFWTFGCINCRNVIPSLQEWYAKYHDQGLEIVAIHTPEFSYERDPAAVESAIAELGVTWPVAMDNEWTTWRSYANRFWPAMYILDKNGHIRYLKIGEGQYAQTEAIIQALLAE
jgi:thiol-disulfide isomerase/thioredoxin